MTRRIVFNDFPTGDIYIGIKGVGDATTNKILYEALEGANISLEHEGKKYGGKPICVWKVNPGFVKMLYRKRRDFDLLFDVYMEKDYTMQIFCIVDPLMQKKAKNNRPSVVKKMKKKIQEKKGR